MGQPACGFGAEGLGVDDGVLIDMFALPLRGAERGLFNAYCFIQSEVLIVWASILPLSHTLKPDSSHVFEYHVVISLSTGGHFQM